MRTLLCFLVVLLSLSALVADVNADWKFWKKDKSTTEASVSVTTEATTTTTTTTTTVKPTSSGSSWKFWKKEKTTTVAPAAASTTTRTATARPTLRLTTASPKQGLAAAADPALAIGVGNTGGNIRQDARNQPRKPNPGTEVGLDISQPKPARPGVGGNAQGYRDWAADLVGAGDSGRQSPKLPDTGPALSSGGSPGNRPASAPGTPTGQPAAAGNRPASIHGTPSGQQVSANGGKAAASTTPQPTSTTARMFAGAPKPTVKIGQHQPTHGGFPQLSPGSPSSPSSPTNSLPGGKSYAQVAGTGGNGGRNAPSTTTRGPLDNPRVGSANQPGRPSAGAAAAGGLALGGAAAIAGSSAGKTYSSNPTYSKGNAVTDEDLEKLSEALFIKDVNNANKFITLNVQKQTSSGSPKDEAPQPLLQVKPEALQISTIQKVLSIYDNYKLDTREHEHISPAQRQEESLLIDTFLSTNVMSAAMRFLADKNFVKKDYYDYKDTLRRIWFNLYSRGEGKVGSTGFEHVFLTELKLGTEVSGLHNWIYFNAEELKNRLDYLGYIKKLDLGNKAAIVKAHIKFNGIDKPVTNVFIGTSPELEMALYTVCFFARPEAACPVSLGGSKFNIITHKFRYRGHDLIGSAYPDI